MEKCIVTPTISTEKKGHVLDQLTTKFIEKQRVLDLCRPLQKGTDHLWLLPSGKLIRTLGYHGEIDRPLHSFYNELEAENTDYANIEGYWVANSVLDMIRVTQTPASTSVDLAIDTHVSSAQWQTLKACIDQTSDHEVFVDISYPAREDQWHEETIRNESREFYDRGYTRLRSFVAKTQQNRREYC